MQREDNQQQKGQHQEENQTELSDVWQELLGLRPDENHVLRGSGFSQQAIPILESDPWTKLLEAENIELIDLQKMHLPISECEVEEVLQLMQEQTALDQSDGKDLKN